MRRSTLRSRLPVSQHPLRMLLAFAALLLAAALPAQAQEGAQPIDPQVVVVPADGSQPRTVAWSQLVDHVDATSFEFAEPGRDARSVTGISLALLFRRLGVASATWSGIAADRADGGATAISSQQMLSTGGIAGVVFMDGDGVLKLLRQTTTYPQLPFELASAIDGRLTLRLERQPKVTASQPEALVGQALRFSATLPPGIDPARVTYEWDFDDDSDPVRTRDSIVTRAFERLHSYKIRVTFYVDGRRWDEDVPPFTTVRVVRGAGGPPARRRAAPSTNTRRSGSAQGQVDTQVATPPPSTPAPSYTPTPSDTPAPTPAATPTPTPPATPATSTPTPPPNPHPTRTPAATATTPPQPRGVTVDGYLLASAGAPLPAGAAWAQAAETRQAIAEEAAKPLHVPAVAWVLVALAGLLMVGWGLESRTTLPYFKP
jgi:hypothetical protein